MACLLGYSIVYCLVFCDVQLSGMETDHCKVNIFTRLLVYVTPSPLHKQCPAIPPTSNCAHFATRDRTCRACGTILNSLPSRTGQWSANDSLSKLHLSFISGGTTWEHLFNFPLLIIPLLLTTSSLDCLLTLSGEISCCEQSHSITVIRQVPLTTQSTFINILSLKCW